MIQSNLKVDVRTRGSLVGLVYRMSVTLELNPSIPPKSKYIEQWFSKYSRIWASWLSLHSGIQQINTYSCFESLLKWIERHISTISRKIWGTLGHWTALSNVPYNWDRIPKSNITLSRERLIWVINIAYLTLNCL